MKDQEKSLWHDLMKDKYYIIEYKNDKKEQVYKTGDTRRLFSPVLTGQKGFKERQSCKIKNFHTKDLISLKNDENCYSPQNNKFRGYAQFPNYLNNVKACNHLTSKLFQDEQSSRDQSLRSPNKQKINKKLEKINQFHNSNNQQKQLLKNSRLNQFLQLIPNNNMGITNAFQQKLKNQQTQKEYFDESLINFQSKKPQSFNHYQSIEQFRLKKDYHNNQKNQITTYYDLMNQVNQSQQEFEGYKSPKERYKANYSKLQLHSMKVQSNSELHINFDKKIDKLANPAAYINKDIKKKKNYINPLTGKTETIYILKRC